MITSLVFRQQFQELEGYKRIGKTEFLNFRYGNKATRLRQQGNKFECATFLVYSAAVRSTQNKSPDDLQSVDDASENISDSNIKNGRFLNHVMAWKQVNLIFKRIYKYVNK